MQAHSNGIKQCCIHGNSLCNKRLINGFWPTYLKFINVGMTIELMSAVSATASSGCNVVKLSKLFVSQFLSRNEAFCSTENKFENIILRYHCLSSPIFSNLLMFRFWFGVWMAFSFHTTSEKDFCIQSRTRFDHSWGTCILYWRATNRLKSQFLSLFLLFSSFVFHNLDNSGNVYSIFCTAFSFSNEDYIIEFVPEIDTAEDESS